MIGVWTSVDKRRVNATPTVSHGRRLRYIQARQAHFFTVLITNQPQGEQAMKYVLILMSMLGVSFSANADDSMKTLASKHGFDDTQARLETVLKEKGLTVFAKIDHADGAKKVGLKMQPATVTIFGNPKGGTPFMVASPESAIDFPLKTLVWEDASGKVYFGYNTVSSIVAKHKIKGQDELAGKLDGLLSAIAKAATE